MAWTWLCVEPHPDDAVLGASVALRRHLTATNPDGNPFRNPHVLTLTRGTKSSTRTALNGEWTPKWWAVGHNPAVEGYTALDEATFGQARMRENVAALGAHGYPPSRQHEAGLTDSAVTVAAAKAAIVAAIQQLGAPAGVYTTSDVADVHPDHLAAGRAVRELRAERPDLCNDARWFVHPNYWDRSDLLDQANGLVWMTAASAEEARRQVNACRAYGAWQPRSGAFAVGQQSVPEMFSKQLATPKALLHS